MKTFRVLAILQSSSQTNLFLSFPNNPLPSDRHLSSTESSTADIMFHNLELGTKCLITDFAGEPFSAVEGNYIYEVIILEDEQTNSTENENSTGSYFLGNFSIFSGDDTSSFCISSEADSVTTNSVTDSERRT